MGSQNEYLTMTFRRWTTKNWRWKYSVCDAVTTNRRYVWRYYPTTYLTLNLRYSCCWEHPHRRWPVLPKQNLCSVFHKACPFGLNGDSFSIAKQSSFLEQSSYTMYLIVILVKVLVFFLFLIVTPFCDVISDVIGVTIWLVWRRIVTFDRPRWECTWFWRICDALEWKGSNN